jgi:hypothetical protein
MYIIRRRKGRGHSLMLYKRKRATRKAFTVPTVKSSDVSTPTIDITQLGSGMKGIRNANKVIGLHETNGKKKFNKFISLNL